MPYFLFVAAGGAPMMFLEVGLGQFMSQGNLSIWDICPIFKGNEKLGSVSLRCCGGGTVGVGTVYHPIVLKIDIDAMVEVTK